jgi:hypothetical protein
MSTQTVMVCRIQAQNNSNMGGICALGTTKHTSRSLLTRQIASLRSARCTDDLPVLAWLLASACSEIDPNFRVSMRPRNFRNLGKF